MLSTDAELSSSSALWLEEESSITGTVSFEGAGAFCGSGAQEMRRERKQREEKRGSVFMRSDGNEKAGGVYRVLWIRLHHFCAIPEGPRIIRL